MSRSKTGKVGKGASESEVVRHSRLTAVVAEVSNVEVEPSVRIRASNGHGLGWPPKSAKMAPVKSVAPKLDRKQPCADALSEICQLVVQQILHNWEVVQGSDDPEGPHQMRVGLRRLRSALNCFRPVIDSDALREINQRARSLGRILSELRDADVLATDIIEGVLANHEEDADLRALKATLEEVRTGHRRKVREELDSEDWSAFRLKLLALPELVHGVDQDGGHRRRKRRLGKFASGALGKRWRKMLQAGRRLSKLTIEERHQLRKDLKSFRYSAELLSSLYRAKDVRVFSGRLRRLQDKFGYLNDLVVAQKLKAIEPDRTTDALQLQRAIGYMLGWHTAHADEAWLDIKEEWRLLKRAQVFWRS